MARLDQAYEAIIDSIHASIEAEIVTGGMLSDVREVVRGDRARPRPNTPTIWIFGESATPSNQSTAIKEKWEMPVSLVAIYESNDAEEGYREASRLAALSRSVVLRDRALGLRNIVQDVVSGRFDPSAPHFRKGNLFSSAAQVVVSFFTFE